MSGVWNQHQLPGGLPLFVQRRTGPAVLAARLWVRGGSGSDPAGQRGLHQLLAGVLSRGCGDLDAEALADLVEGRGAALRCEASEDSLVLSLKCAAEDASELLPLLIAMVRRPHLESSQVELERQLNLQTLQRQREDPFQLAHDQLRVQLFGHGPYGHDPLGVDSELEQLGPAQLEAVQPTLGQTGAVLVLCGAVETPALASLEAALTETPWTVAAPTAAPGPGAMAGSRLEGCLQDTEQLVLMLGAATVPLGHADGVALRLLQAHLGMGMSSRLFVVMREEYGLAYDVGVHLPARRGATPFVWHLSSSSERATQACHCLLDEWQRLLQQPLSPQELDLAKAKFLGQDAMGRQTCSQVADRQALVMGHGLPQEFVATSLELARSLSADALLTVAQKHLHRPHLSLCGPQEALSAASAAWQNHPLVAG
jgi:predicted Zn-dependent peptidase